MSIRTLEQEYAAAVEFKIKTITEYIYTYERIMADETNPDKKEWLRDMIVEMNNKLIELRD